MKIISSKVHGILDYTMGILLIASPWLLDFADNRTAMLIPIILGIAMIGLALITDYEMGATPVISMAGHLTVDLISGIFLAVSPWLFGFADDVYLPHLILGIAEVGASLMTERSPGRRTSAV
ncbi:MAG: SPW repeat protein [Bacteroidota bacterium]|nr:SPW repeat protein [Bacteroidota bacterium]